MSRLKETLRTLFIVAATVSVTEWVHYRLGERTVFGLSSGRGTTQVITDPEDDPGFVADSEFQKYVQVLEAMQEDHGLSVERAAEESALTVAEFRDIERRVQRDDALVARAREVLRKRAEVIWNSRREAIGEESPAAPAD